MQLFRLLDLPSLALNETIECFNPIELFTLSQCSKKMTRKVKKARDTRNFRLTVNFSHLEITINEKYAFEVYEKSSEEFNEYDLGYCSFDSIDDEKSEVPITFNDYDQGSSITFWDDTFLGLKKICFHLANFFGCKIETFDSNFVVSDDKNQKFSEIRILETKFFDKITDEDLKWFLNTVKISDELKLYARPSEHFSYNFETIPPKSLIIRNSFWFSLENILSMNSCVYIELFGSLLTNQDLDVFMTLWMIGDYPILKYLKVESINLNDEDMIVGLTSMKNIHNPELIQKRVNGYRCQVNGGVDIRNDIGMMGTLRLDAEENSFSFLVLTN